MTDVGLTIVEGINNGASAYKSPSKRNIGLLGQFNRGAKFTPTRVTSMEDFNNMFGGQSTSFFGPGIVKSIFDEAGSAPVTLYLARVVGEDSVSANGSVNITSNGQSFGAMSATAAYKGKDDPGTWANGIKVSLYSYGSRVKNMFTLIVQHGAVMEQYSYETLAEIQSAVNRVSKFVSVEFTKEVEKEHRLTLKNLQGTITANTSLNEVNGTGTSFNSELSVGGVIYNGDKEIIGTIASIVSDTKLILTSKALHSASGVCSKRDDKVFVATLAGGIDGEVVESDFYPVADNIEPKGLACFDGYDVQIIGCTEFHSLSMAKVLNEYLKERKNPIGIINLPLNADEGTAELYAMELQTPGTSFMAGAYLGWCKVPDANGNPILIPAMGPVLGAAYVRTPYARGNYIHIPPGGVDSLFTNVLDVIPPRLSQSTINRLVQQFSCNHIQYLEGTGFYVGSSRTYSTSSLYASVHIRLQTSFYIRALDSLLKFMEQKPNTPELKREALVELNTFFQNEYDNGALERSVPFSKSYQGICDRSNNPADQDRKIVNIDVLWIPTECTESIRVSLQRNDGILTLTESEA